MYYFWEVENFVIYKKKKNKENEELGSYHLKIETVDFFLLPSEIGILFETRDWSEHGRVELGKGILWLPSVTAKK